LRKEDPKVYLADWLAKNYTVWVVGVFASTNKCFGETGGGT